MNIFPLSKNPEEAARWACDQHVVKILSEAVLVYSTSMYHVYPEKWRKLKERGIAWGPLTNIPLVRWAKNGNNRRWLAKYIHALYSEYYFRFGKSHKAYDAFKEMIKHYGESEDVNYNLITFIKVMPETFMESDPIKAYQAYYLFKYKEGFKKPMRWTKREKPAFLLEEILV